MTSPSVVRVAGPDDFNEVWRLLVLFHEENALFHLAPEKVQWLMARMIWPDRIPPNDTGCRGVIGVIGPSHSLEGVAVLTVTSNWYSHDLYLEEYGVFVDPPHRKSNHAQAICDWMKSQARETGLKLFTGVVATDRTEAKCRLYRRKFPKAGEFFCIMPETATMRH